MLTDNIVAVVLDRIASPPSPSTPIAERQSGVIPYTTVEQTTVFLLVTSRRTGRWIFPKGRLMDGLAPWESATKEAYDEAGIEGIIETAPVGSYRSWKTRGMRRFAIEVAMYPFLVERQFDKWRETGERHRHWVTLPEAIRLIADKRLAEFVRIIANRARSAPPHAPEAADTIA
jgi:8-oxo-dGTP pyrophosphatase MutT (NUDIX family)